MFFNKVLCVLCTCRASYGIHICDIICDISVTGISTLIIIDYYVTKSKNKQTSLGNLNKTII